MNIFADPGAVYALLRRPILGLDNGGGAGVLRGLSSWALDTTVSKDFRINERFGATLMVQITNVLTKPFPTGESNAQHRQPADLRRHHRPVYGWSALGHRRHSQRSADDQPAADGIWSADT